MDETLPRPDWSALDRREMFRVAGAALLLLPACGAPSPSPSPPDGGAPPAGGACTKDANTLVLPLSQNPQLAQVGGSVSLTDSRYTDPVCGNDGFIVIRASESQFAAFSDSCTHACCPVQPAGQSLRCPCHGSVYSLQGQVLQGPAYQALPTIPVCFDGENVYVQLA